ncbi:MAG: DUF2125 domain-containing protein [Rhizobiales bacterium]|nr:DUF2125 domain-containing protein [Hyphomicrobiales bacterium]
MLDPQPAPRRRRWLLFVPFALLVALAGIWTGLWFYAASQAEAAIAGWRDREAKSGRTYECGSQSISGFPFRIEVRCGKPMAELRGKGAQVVLNGADLVMLAQIYQPTLLIGEFTSPMTVAESGQPPAFFVNWTLGQSSLRGTPRAPQRGSLVFDNLAVQRADAKATVLNAKRFELHGRMAEGSASANPVIDVGLRATAASMPELHQMTAAPLDADVSATLRGLADFMPKPWPVRFRELQARGGKIDIVNARVQQGEVIAVSSGTLSLTESGNLDGQLQMTVVNLEHVLKQLDLEAMVSQGRVGSAIDRLDKLVPGLGRIARKNAGPGILAGLDAIGKRTTLEGKPAVTVPLRFVDGQVMLGPLNVGRTPPLF